MKLSTLQVGPRLIGFLIKVAAEGGLHSATQHCRTSFFRLLTAVLCQCARFNQGLLVAPSLRDSTDLLDNQGCAGANVFRSRRKQKRNEGFPSKKVSPIFGLRMMVVLFATPGFK